MTRVASVDCGTNSTRVLVAEPDGQGGLVQLDRRMVITRLGQGVDRTGRLATEAVDRTVDVLRTYRDILDGLGVRPADVRVSATAAARDAANRDDFFDRAEQAVGARPELLSGAEEAVLSFRGATAGLDAVPTAVFDLGGGSTEFAVGTTDPTGSISIQIGCVRLTERFLESDPPRPEELTAAISYTEAWLADVQRELPQLADVERWIGLAGTVSTVAAVELGLADYDRDRIHHFVLTREAAEDVFRTLATEARADRVHNPGLEAARADVIVGGCCALVAIMRTFGVGSLIVSESDILDGMALSVLDRLA